MFGQSFPPGACAGREARLEDTRMPYVLGELIITLACIVVEVVLLVNSASIPPASGRYPQGLLLLAFALSVAFLLVCIRRIRKNGMQAPEERPEPGSAVQILVLCGMTCLYLFLLDIVGYLIMTPLFVLACILYLGMRDKLVLVLLPVILTGFTYYLFGNILFIFLPRGILG